jgi:3-dehydroquinate synthase
MDLHDKSYPIYVGQQLLATGQLLSPLIAGKQVLIVTQPDIAQFYLPLLKRVLQDYQCDTYFFPGGEEHKTIVQWQAILDALLQQGHERSTTLIALGGGVVGDITGFAAACYLRGVCYIQIPTTLIGQVDAAIGGKTAINHPQAKNIIGAFHQPQCVISDIDMLKTLPQRELVSGLAEVIKYGLICDTAFFSWLEQHIDALLQKDPQVLLHAIYTSARIKAEIVSADEKDQGLRNLLNLGHTFGHALEVMDAYQGLLHGEAVGLGMLLAAKLSMYLGWLAESDFHRISTLLHVAGLVNVNYVFPAPAEFIRVMMHDKKVQDGKLRLILLKGIGEAVLTSAISDQQLYAVLAR